LQRESNHFTGQEVIFLSRHSINKAGQGLYRAIVRGHGEDNAYRLTLEKSFSDRQPSAVEQAVLETIFEDCCGQDGSCTSLADAVREAKPSSERLSFCHVPNQGCDREGHITALRLPGEGLRCNFPESIGRLRWLTRLGLEDNAITGKMEEVLEVLTPLSLESLHLGNNQFSGSLPCISEEAALSSTAVIDLSGNKIGGRIPGCFFTNSMQIVILRENSLAGNLPWPLPELPRLQMFIASMQSDGPGITGTIPDLAAWPALTLLDLSGNRLQGPLPELPPLLRTLRVGGNELSGELPADLSGKENLRVIDVADNRLSGPLPLSLPPEVRALRLGWNNFHGTIPHASWFPDVTGLGTNLLQELRLPGNLLTGTIPSRLALLPNLWGLDLSGNRLGGSLTPYAELITRNSLLEFDVSDNELTGPLPAEVSRMDVFRKDWNRTMHRTRELSQRVLFNVSGNMLSGPFPSAILEHALGEAGYFELGLQGNRFDCPAEGELSIPPGVEGLAAIILGRLYCIDSGEVVSLAEHQGIMLPTPSEQQGIPITTMLVEGNASSNNGIEAPSDPVSDTEEGSGLTLTAIIIIAAIAGILLIIIAAAVGILAFVGGFAGNFTRRRCARQRYENFTSASSAPVLGVPCSRAPATAPVIPTTVLDLQPSSSHGVEMTPHEKSSY